MAILFESSSYIELLLKKALDQEGLNYTEQYRLYSGGRFSEVIYVADFLIRNPNVRLIVECDGFTYHSGKEASKKSKNRDDWLIEHGYKVLHISTKQIKYQMPLVINTIKKEIGLPIENPTKILPKEVKKGYQPESLQRKYEIELYIYYMQKKTDVFLVYQYRRVKDDNWSDERKKKCTNIQNEWYESTALYLALCDLKRAVNIKIYYCGSVVHENYNVNRTFRNIIHYYKNGNDILHNNSITLKYTNLEASSDTFWTFPEKTLRSLRSRCRQIANSNNTVNDIIEFDFREIQQ